MGKQIKKTSTLTTENDNKNLFSKTDIQNLFSYLKQECKSPMGVIDKTKALTNLLIKESVFDYLINSVLQKNDTEDILTGSAIVEGFTYTGICTKENNTEHLSIVARNNSFGRGKGIPGVVTGFLLRKVKNTGSVKNFLEARLVMNNGKEYTLRYNYKLAC